MNELDIYKRAYGKLVAQVTQLTADLALADAQIDVLNEQLKETENQDTENKEG